MEETKVQIGEDVILDIGTHSDWYISAVCYNGESINIDLRRKADRHKEWWLADTPQTEQTDDAYFLELMGAVERGEISDAGANQAWYEYINHKDEPQTEDEGK